ncbi:HlyD family secretion protein [Chromohalobacter israelensis]|uniref:Secretion protein HlyD n=1 Tax=Chromohalobacter israelensis (strain ATCC BAA-138 / DSM 3043 / CIP 106854 / NCIMB 13768 / 1H11) TaxID=290398 RepID=Q1QYT8_CHRI1|nr:HlyD family secretion protein [Chromohalobacter salexigens]ABE58370.1 secretion protein HlyD [Chromohalobacter salexigens DSM 3043]
MTHDTSMTDDASTPPTSHRRLPRGAKWLLLAIIVVLFLVWLGFAIAHRMTHVSAQDARVMADQITVSSRLDGRITHFTLTEGDMLVENDEIATLYSAPDERRLASLEADVVAQRARLDYEKTRLAMAEKQLEGGMNLTRQELDASKAAEKAAQARLTEAERDFKRADALYKKHSVSEQRRDQDYYAYQAALAEHAQAQQEVQVNQALADNARVGFINGSQMPLPNPDVLRQQVKIAERDLASAAAKRDEERLRLDDLHITSPSDGVINKTLVDQGEYVSAGQPILMMHDPDKLWVEANIKETDIGELRQGQPVAITVDAFPDAIFKGHVSVIGRAATSQFALLPDPNPSGNFTKITQRLPVRIRFDDGPTELIGPGMMVEVDIDVSDTEPRDHG